MIVCELRSPTVRQTPLRAEVKSRGPSCCISLPISRADRISHLHITGEAASFLASQAAAASSEIEALFFGSDKTAPPFKCFTYSTETELFFHLRQAWVRFRQLYLLRVPVVGYWEMYKQGAPAAEGLMTSLLSYVSTARAEAAAAEMRQALLKHGVSSQGHYSPATRRVTEPPGCVVCLR